MDGLFRFDPSTAKKVKRTVTTEDEGDVEVSMEVVETPIGLFPLEDIVCAFHGGREVVAQTPFEKDGKMQVKYEYSKKVGFQEDCYNCRNQANEITMHVNYVMLHDLDTEIRFGFAVRSGDDQEKLRNALEKALRE